MAQVTWTSYAFQLPEFAAEELSPETLIPGGARLDAAQFNAEDAQTITLVAGAVTAGSNKTLTLTAPLSFDIPAGTILDFGSGEFCTLNNGAKKGATTITGVTVAADLEGSESVVFKGVLPRKPIRAGILVGRTYAERDAGTAYGPADVATPDDEIFLVAFGVTDAAISSDVTLLRHGTLIYEDKLPDWASLASNVKAAIRSRYHCLKSA
jgi:hypothetical protein